MVAVEEYNSAFQTGLSQPGDVLNVPVTLLDDAWVLQIGSSLVGPRFAAGTRAQEAVGGAVVLGPCERLLVLAGVSVFVPAAHLRSAVHDELRHGLGVATVGHVVGPELLDHVVNGRAELAEADRHGEVRR